MKRILYFLIFLVATPAWAQDSLENADDAYMQEHYKEAAELYEATLQEGANADVFYNLGNTYYRMKDMGRAVLNYERALALQPGNEDIRYNLEICQSKIADQFNKPSEMFFITWLKELVYSKNADQWGICGIVVLIFAMIFWGVYRFGNRVGIKKFGFFFSMLSFLIVILSNVAAAMNYYAFHTDNRAVILTDSHLYKSSNDKEEPLRNLHPGTTLEILQENSKGWSEVELPNGKKGWIKQEDAEKVRA